MATSPPQDNASDQRPPARFKIISAGVIGNLFEWYDFTVYGFFAPVIAMQFFGPSHDGGDLLKAFAVFAVGYFARPLGALIFGSIGDRLGRRIALLISLAVMAVPTLGMVLIPTWASVGLLSPILLILYRILQGISIGGEFTGATAYLTEHAAQNRRGFTGAMTVSSAMLGILLGSLVFTVMVSNMTTEFVQTWGWRLAFGGGLIILFVAGWLRWRMPVSPHFKKAKAAGTIVAHPVRYCLRTQRGPLAQAMMFISLPAMLCYAVTVYLSEFLSEQGHLSRSKAGLIVTVSIAIAVVLPLLIGAASDRIGRRPFIRWSFVAATVWAIPHFALGASGVPAYAWLAAVVGALILGTMQGVYPAKLSELFPTATRFTGTSIAYNVCFAVFGGTFPFIATWLVHVTGEPMAPGWYLGVIALISTVLVWRLPETGLSPLREV